MVHWVAVKGKCVALPSVSRFVGWQVLQNGGVPYKPMHMVCRPDLVTVIRDALRKASRNERDRPIAVVLHGMVGCGKSVLAAEALRDPSLLRECFPDGVYWLGIGNLREPNDVLLKMHLQLDRIKLGCHNDAQSVDLAKSRLQRWALKNKVGGIAIVPGFSMSPAKADWA